MVGTFHNVLVNTEALSRKDGSKCANDEFFDEVVQKCSFCKDVCEAKVRLGLSCLECESYISQGQEIINAKSDEVDYRIISLLIIIAAMTILVISAIILMAIKLYKQKSLMDLTARRKLLEIGVVREINTSKSYLNNIIRPQKQLLARPESYII